MLNMFVFTLWPGKANSGLILIVILAKAWAALALPTSEPSRANGINASKKVHK